MKSKQKNIAARFGIAEWYGQSFAHMSPRERSEFATYKPDKGTRLSSSERERLAALSLFSTKRKLSSKEGGRLKELTERQRFSGFRGWRRRRQVGHDFGGHKLDQ
ncbi:MAG: hypothetical protein ACYCZ6_13750 [Polaromonas sp.]